MLSLHGMRTVQPAQTHGSSVKVLIIAQKSPMYLTLGLSVINVKSPFPPFFWLAFQQASTMMGNAAASNCTCVDVLPIKVSSVCHMPGSL